MNVAIDATPLTLSSGGIARYTAELAKELAASFPEDRFTLISGQPAAARGALERRWWLWGVQREMSRQRSELFHGSHYVVPWLPLRPSVATVHDLSPWMEPGWHSNARFVRSRFPFVAGLGLATMVVTPSETVRREVIGFWRIHPARVVATPLAAAAHFRPVSPQPHGLPYLLYLGTLEPRKNLTVLVEAWREVRTRHSVDLVLAGRRREDSPEFPDEPGLHILGEIPDDELPAWLCGALAFVYPSLYEGFGLPVIEAMQCGTHVIAASSSAVREVAGDAAQLLDPKDTKSWIAAIEAALSHPERLESWRRRSLERAAAFSWTRTARITREVYEEAIRRFGM